MDLSTKKMVTAFTKMNNALVYFPGGSATSKYSPYVASRKILLQLQNISNVQLPPNYYNSGTLILATYGTQWYCTVQNMLCSIFAVLVGIY